MKIGKWIGGIMGFMAMGPLGALAGYAIGSLFDKASFEGVGENEPYNREQTSEYGQRNSFLFSMLVMASYIVRADGKIMHSENNMNTCATGACLRITSHFCNNILCHVR